MWTGDNEAVFDEMRASIHTILSLGVSGIVFSGADVPGYSGSPTDSLKIAFYQLGVFYPFMRAHAHKDNAYDREPYIGPERVTSVIREALFLRYSLAHYIYWLFYVSSQTGMPLMRPMW